jgi:Acetyltransferase (GNAT) family
MSELQRLKQKIKYNSILRLCHDGLLKIGINFTFFYLVEEGLNLQLLPFNLEEFSEYLVEFLTEDDLLSICSIPERPYDREVLAKRLQNGCRCLVLKSKERIVGYTWFDLSTCGFAAYKFPLKKNEAYLFDAYILMDFRGKQLAPFMRYQCYKELEKLGKTKLYSISETVNKQSINFKKKLNARFIFLGLYVRLFKKLTYFRELRRLVRE